MLMLRTPGDPAALTSAVREEVRAIDPDLPLFGILTLDQALAQGRWQYQIFGTMFSVWWMVLRSALVQLTIGLTIGAAGAIGVGRLLQSVLVHSGARDTTTLAAIAALLAIVSLGACFWPARRATRLDPVNALRYE